ncbi:hypothetical protein C8035_v008942 [Colletotrichum spinosum]|uniref:EthD domain-containing protein n=1 Tax=Colletotrichum spinosum TaxID=1347390 RepID=A0A4V6QEJ4_9PEZI|nr:hypothetical protein C8035_v008942 [Colletotrichum spinosum]
MAIEVRTQSLQKSISIVIFIKRKRSLTQSEFFHYWENVHGPLVKPWAQKHGIIAYTQVHASFAMSQGVTQATPQAVQSLNGFDGYAIFEIPSLDVFEAALEDEYYRDVIETDERKFIDKEAGLLACHGDAKRII